MFENNCFTLSLSFTPPILFSKHVPRHYKSTKLLSALKVIFRIHLKVNFINHAPLYVTICDVCCFPCVHRHDGDERWNASDVGWHYRALENNRIWLIPSENLASSRNGSFMLYVENNISKNGRGGILKLYELHCKACHCFRLRSGKFHFATTKFHFHVCVTSVWIFRLKGKDFSFCV